MKRLFNNTVFSTLDAFVLIALNIVATPILITSLGLAEYGVFVFLSIFSTYGVLSLFGLGMEGALLNFVARYESEGNKHKIQDSLTVSLIYYGIVGLLLGGALYIFAGFIAERFIDDGGSLNRDAIILSINIVSLNVFLQFLTLPFTAVLQGLRRYVITKSLNSVLMVLQYVLVIVTAMYFKKIEIAFLVILGITGIRILSLVYIVGFHLSHFRPFRIRIRKEIVRSLFSYSSILFISRIIGIIFNQMDKILIWLYLAVTQMGIYDVVVRPANLIRTVISVLNAAVIPEVARLHHQKEIAQIRALYIKLVRYAYLLMLPILVVVAVYMDMLLQVWVGVELAQYAYLALVILSVYLIAPVVSMASTIVVGMELVKKTIWISIVASIINMVLSIVLVKSIGLLGLLSATLIAQVFMVFPYVYMMQHVLEMNIKQLFGPIMNILAVAILFVLGNMVLRLLCADTIIMILIAGSLALGHTFINYRYLLNVEERTYLLQKLGLSKTQCITGAVNR